MPYLEKMPEKPPQATPTEPVGGWLLFRLDTLEDVKQK
jgi:hypothetical protein